MANSIWLKFQNNSEEDLFGLELYPMVVLPALLGDPAPT